MKKAASLFAVLLLAAGQIFSQIETPLETGIEDAPEIFKELRRLEGTWFLPSDRGDRLEIWEITNDSTMQGEGLRIKIGTTDTVLLENLRLELRGNTITYFARVRGQNAGQEIPFKLTQSEYLNYLFENPKHDDPKKIRYQILDRRELQVTTEGERNGRTVKTEFVFEREFNPASIQFRARAGLNVFSLFKTNEIGVNPPPDFSARPGWEIGVATVFQGAGGLLNLNVEAGLAGKFPHAKVNFATTRPPDPEVPDSLPVYIRDATYNQTWLTLGLLPEVLFSRKGRLSFVFGGYYARLLINRVKGTEQPIRDTKVFNYNGDFKKNDFGAVVGFNYRRNLGKTDLDGIWGLRFNLGMANIDNLYRQGSGLNNGRVGLAGVSLSYSINLLKT